MEFIQKMLSLETPILAILAAGYLSYRLAYTGKDGTHRTIDVIFLVTVYAFTAQIAGNFAYYFMLDADYVEPQATSVANIIGICTAVLIAAFWRRWGENWTFKGLRMAGISYSDRYPTAFQSVTLKPGVKPTLLIVTKKDGTQLMSEELALFKDLPFGACIYGEDGSVALYVTHRKFNGEDDWEREDPSIHGDWGALVTVVPASEIAEVALRADKPNAKRTLLDLWHNKKP